jgi:hypothetical protein
MAQTLASELNQPLNPSFLSQSSQRMQSDPNLRTRAAKARELEPLARAEETRLAEQTGLEEARLKREQIGREEELAREGMGRKEQIFGRLEDSYGQQPERTITAFNPERGIELATMTALLGAFAGSVSGTAALQAMEGVSTGYRTGQEDLYKREVEAYDAAVNQYKQKIKQAEEIAKNSLVLEAEQRGLGAIELKKLDPLLNDGLIIAKAKQGDVRGMLESIKQAKDLGDQIRLKEIEAGMGSVAPSITEVVNPDDPTQVLRIDAKQYKGGGVGSPGVIGLVAPKNTQDKLREDEQKTAYNTNRILQSARQISNIVKKNAGAETPGAIEALVSSLPLIDVATNVVRGADRQIVASAQADIIDSLLFLATGAAYNKEQLAQQRMSYLPLWSDKPEAVSAKRDRLIGLIEGAKIRAGAAFTPEMEQALQEVFIAPAQQQGAQQPNQTQQSPTIQPGTILDGFRFKGGDPSKQNNWEKV